VFRGDWNAFEKSGARTGRKKRVSRHDDRLFIRSAPEIQPGESRGEDDPLTFVG
jgi:hypothetical protein